jgi:hypothetical protein
MIQVVHPGSGFLPIPDPGVKKAPDPGIRNTATSTDLRVALPGLSVDSGLLQVDCRIDYLVLLLRVFRRIILGPRGFS